MHRVLRRPERLPQARGRSADTQADANSAEKLVARMQSSRTSRYRAKLTIPSNVRGTAASCAGVAALARTSSRRLDELGHDIKPRYSGFSALGMPLNAEIEAALRVEDSLEDAVV
ncbi:MAG: hypothetical protein RL591_925 [Planctomycetota bacterium]